MQIAQEKELVIDPGFLPGACSSTLPGISAVEILPQAGKIGQRALTRYRYDVVLHVGERATALTGGERRLESRREFDCRAFGTSWPNSRPAMSWIVGVPNQTACASILPAVAINRGGAMSVLMWTTLREELAQNQPVGEDPEAFWTLAKPLAMKPE